MPLHLSETTRQNITMTESHFETQTALGSNAENALTDRLLILSRSQLTVVLAALKFGNLEEAMENGFDDEQLLLHANDVLHL